VWHAWGKGEVFIGFCFGGPKGRHHWEELGIGGRITLNGPWGDRNRWGELDSGGSG
jgi:hypothetical protein